MDDRKLRAFYNYGVAYPLLAGYRLLSLFQEKARAYFEIRKNLAGQLAEKRAKLPSDKPLVLVHVASVGELLQANPLITGLVQLPEPPLVALSYTSASVLDNFPKGVKAHLITPAPPDTTSAVENVLDLLSPRLIIFSTYDLWPNLTLAAAERGLPLLLVNAAVAENSARLALPARLFFPVVYSKLQAAGATTEAAAARLARLGVPEEKITVTGDCRYDQTLARCQAVEEDDADLAPLPPSGFLVVAGSTWPEDHRHLLPALSLLLGRDPETAAVIAPHEPSAAHLREIEEFFLAAGFPAERYSALRKSGATAASRVVVVDVLGVLYKLYKRGKAAYVGGSFRQGVHSVMEPAGMGLPVLVGPVHRNSAEALAMIAAGGAKVVRNGEEIVDAITAWKKEENNRRAAAETARRLIAQNAGATEKTLNLVRRFLEK